MICHAQKATPLRLTSKPQVTRSVHSKAVLNHYHGFRCLPNANASPIHATVCRASGNRSRVQPTVVCSKVAVLGAAGGIGQPLSMLLKMNNMITDLALYDIANVAGVAADLSHCNTPVKVSKALYLFFDNRDIFI